MPNPMWQKIYLEAINGLCANHSHIFCTEEGMARKIIEEATLLANMGCENFENLYPFVELNE